MFFDKRENFDDLVRHVPEIDRKPLLSRFLIVDLANSWLMESRLKYTPRDVFELVYLILGERKN
jgi:hypothetical protein